jgi:hypothetical protein
MTMSVEHVRVEQAPEITQNVRDFCDRTGEPYPVTKEDYDKIIARMKAVGM